MRQQKTAPHGEAAPQGRTTLVAVPRGLHREAQDVLGLARTILARAQADAHALIVQTRQMLAREARRVRRKARERGFHAGQRIGAAQIEQLLARETVYASALRQAQTDCVNLALEAAGEIAAVDLVPNGDVLARRIERGITQLIELRGLRISVAPAASEIVRRSIQERLPHIKSEVVADPEIEPGDAIVTTVSGSVTLDWRADLADVKARLLAAEVNNPRLR